MSFFITSAGPGNGANLGGIAGADKHCQTLGAAAGQGSKTWHAYLSAAAAGGQPAVNARDRIGAGPWYNAKGARIAQSVADLHGDTVEVAQKGNNLTKTTALTEKGETVNGVGDTPNRHDILTGSQTDGRAFTDGVDHTCGNWTSNATGTAQLGHSDRSTAIRGSVWRSCDDRLDDHDGRSPTRRSRGGAVSRRDDLVRRWRQTGGRGRKMRGLLELLRPYRSRTILMFVALRRRHGGRARPPPRPSSRSTTGSCRATRRRSPGW